MVWTLPGTFYFVNTQATICCPKKVPHAFHSQSSACQVHYATSVSDRDVGNRHNLRFRRRCGACRGCRFPLSGRRSLAPAGMQNTSVIMGQATYVGQVLWNDQPWESSCNLGCGSIVTDPDTKQLRMYYEVHDKTNEYNGCMAMATSDDGIHWTKPALNVTGTTYTTDASNNFVSLPQKWMCAGCVFVDPNAPAGTPAIACRRSSTSRPCTP